MKGEVRFVENSPEFWTTGAVYSVGDSLLIKRHKAGHLDHIHIAKITATSTQKFKFPTGGLDFILLRLQEFVDFVDEDDNGEHCFPGLTEVTTYPQFTTEEFWDSPFCVKFMRFKVRIFKTDYGRIAFRLLNEVPEKFKLVKFGSIVWNGPSTTVSYESFKAMVEIFYKIYKT